MKLFVAALLAISVAVLGVDPIRRAAAESVAAAPRKVADFSLNDHAGAKRSLAEWSDKPVLVVVFLGTECPLAKLYGQKLGTMEPEFAKRGVQFIGINSNQQDTLQELAGYGTKFGVKFPLLKDPGAKVAEQFGATRTPEAFVLDRDRVIRYQGRIDDQYGVGSARDEATKTELVDAIEAVLADKPVAMAVTQPVGCLIGRRTPSASSDGVTYAKDIAPVLQNRCVSCHREGQIAPFTLTEYDDVVAWADMCLEVVDDGRMPPWGANPAHGEFLNDARLTPEESKLLHAWVDAGTPEGNANDLPALRKFVDGWQMPKPDAVYQMPEEFEVPAHGTVPYKYFVWDPGFTEDKWVYGAEARPGNPEVVHHLFLFYIPPGQEKHRPEDPLFNAIAAFAPGMPPIVGPEKYAVRIPAGSKLAFQIHYTPNGKATTDRSEAAVVFADPKQVEKEVKVAAAMNFKFLIPPFHPNYPIAAEKKFKEDTLLYTLTPHMHYRGKAFRFTAHYPDGKEEILLDVPRYDFNWQIVYLLKQPKLLPAGTVVKLEGHFDNSADNPLNPDPAQFVRWGDQTWDEMMLGSMTVSNANEDLRAPGGPLAALADESAGGN